MIIYLVRARIALIVRSLYAEAITLLSPSWEGLGVGSPIASTNRPMKQQIVPYDSRLVERARQLRKNMTPGERKLWQHLRNRQMMGYKFERQRPIDRFIVDFYCRDLMLAIEIDGSSHDSDGARQRDRERQARLEGLGVCLLRFQEREVMQEMDGVLVAIENWLARSA